MEIRDSFPYFHLHKNFIVPNQNFHLINKNKRENTAKTNTINNEIVLTSLPLTILEFRISTKESTNS